MTHLSFSNLPGFSKFFVDFMNDYVAVRSFFQIDRFDRRAIREQIERVADRYPFRDQLASILTRQNRDFGNNQAAIDNASRLASSNAVAVVTGQQMGLLGGPLFTAVKALATVRWCQFYKETFPEYDFVPIFWMELEDHDFAEVNRAIFLSTENDLVNVTYDGYDIENKIRRPVGRIALDDGIFRTIERIRAIIQPSSFTDPVLRVVQSAYSPGESMGSAFGKLLAAWMGDRGLVLCDPSDAKLKQLAAPIFRKELTDPLMTSRLVSEQSGRLTGAGYHVQVETQPTNLFFLDDGRAPFNESGSEKVRISAEDAARHQKWLLQTVENDPTPFVPNVVLRPLMQDHVLPTVTYVGGPSEIAYWAQFTLLYAHFNIPQPVVVPRPFLTILEKKNRKVLDKYGLTLTDVFRDRESLIEQLVIQNSSIDIEGLFGEWLTLQEQKARTIEIAITRLDPSLKGAVETALEKIRHAMMVLKEKTVAADQRSQSQTTGQISKAFTNLFPNSDYQERTLNTIQFLNKYDRIFLDRIFAELELEAAGMQVIEF